MAKKNGNPIDAESYRERGSEYLAKEEWDKAIADFNEAIRLDPKKAGGYASRGLCYDAKGDYDRAIADFSEAIRINDLAGYYESRGQTYLHKGDYDKAIADFNEAIRLYEGYKTEGVDITSNGHVYIYRGITYASKGDYDAANADWEAVSKMDVGETSTAKETAKKIIAITQKQRANWSGGLNLAPNLLSLVLLQEGKKQLTGDFIFMAAGAVIGAIIGNLLMKGTALPFFFAGFFGTCKSNFDLLWYTFKHPSEGESKIGSVLFSLVLSLIISPVWFVIKLVKRLKAFFRMRSIEKRLAKEIDPSAFSEIGRLGEYIGRI
ncbi:MAG: tetratricopeptide repeat protein [Spirochaetales bacterium]|jgi:tetratricopeptide (TPR) repeat protein|nr:tetratricopeptide repeat protein [Spirochaetales bacterium]